MPRLRIIHSRRSRRSLIAASIAFSLLLVFPIAAWARWDQYQGGETHEGGIDGPSAPLRVAWTNRDIDLSGDDIAGGLSAPVVAEDGTIVAVASGAVLAFEGDDGSERFSVNRDLGPASQPAIGAGADGPIVVYTEGLGDADASATASASPSPDGGSDDEEPFDSHVNAISLETGEPSWPEPVQLSDVVQTPVAVDDTTAYVGDVSGGVTAVDLATGEVRWTADVGTRVAGAVTIDDGRALVTSLGGRDEPSEVVAFDAETGEEEWRGTPEGASNLLTPAVAAEGRLVLLDALGGVVALDAQDGRALWRTEVINPLAQAQPFFLGASGFPAPAVAGDQVFATDVTGRVYAFDGATGAPQWDFALNDPVRFSPPIVTDEHVLVASDSGVLSAIDRSTGHLVWRVDAGANVLRGLADGGEQIVGVTGGEDAGVVAFVADSGRPLLDEVSPTTFDLGALAIGFALGGILVGLLALVIARPLQRRLGPMVINEPGPDEEPA